VSRRSAVSLVEILVVIGIIALLAAALGFVLSGPAKTQAYTTQTISSMKQIGTAISLYRSDHDGALPNDWKGQVMIPYLGGPAEALYSPFGKDLTGNFRDGYFYPVSFGMRNRNTSALSEAAKEYDIRAFDPDEDIWMQCLHISKGQIKWGPFGKTGKPVGTDNLGVKAMALRPDLSVTFAPVISCWELRMLPDEAPLIKQISTSIAQCDGHRGKK
jgi:type II secretory pathway pseudopilin PulG